MNKSNGETEETSELQLNLKVWVDQSTRTMFADIQSNTASPSYRYTLMTIAAASLVKVFKAEIQDDPMRGKLTPPVADEPLTNEQAMNILEQLVRNFLEHKWNKVTEIRHEPPAEDNGPDRRF